MRVCKCPAGASLPDIPTENCKAGFGQIQKLIFQRIYKTPGVKNAFTEEAAPTKLASWTPLLAASDGTKVVVTPYIYSPTTEAGDAVTYGGGNDSLNGVEEILGKNPTTFTANFRELQQYIVKALKALECEDVGVYFVDANGSIAALADDPETPTEYYPIPIQSLMIGDYTFGGFDTPDMNSLQLSLPDNWSDNMVKIIPEDFNPLEDLVKTT